MALTAHDVGSAEIVGVHTGGCAAAGVSLPWAAYALPAAVGCGAEGRGVKRARSIIVNTPPMAYTVAMGPLGPGYGNKCHEARVALGIPGERGCFRPPPPPAHHIRCTSRLCLICDHDCDPACWRAIWSGHSVPLLWSATVV